MHRQASDQLAKIVIPDWDPIRDFLAVDCLQKPIERDLKTSLRKLRQLLEEDNDLTAIKEAGKQTRIELEKVMAYVNDKPDAQDELSKHSLSLSDLCQGISYHLDINNDRLYLKERPDQEQTPIDELARSTRAPLATIEQANRYRLKLEQELILTKSIRSSRVKIIGDLQARIKKVEKIIRGQQAKFSKSETIRSRQELEVAKK